MSDYWRNGGKDMRARLWCVLGGAAIGTLLGVLLAPHAREKGQTLMSKVGAMVPMRVKAAAALGAVKAGGAEAIRKDK